MSFLKKKKFTDGNYNYIFEGNENILEYTLLEKLGRGSYGTVYKAVNKNNDVLYALKIFKNQQKYKNSTQSEINILKKLNQNEKITRQRNKRELISKMFHSFDYEYHTISVLKLYSSNLYEEYKKQKKFEDIAQYTIFCDLVLGLEFLKNNKIIHCDLKPENILFYDDTSFHVVISDFGLSISEEMASKEYNIQSLWYRAPEVILRKNFDYNIDIWSLGCIIFEIAFGRELFTGTEEKKVVAKIISIIGEPSNEYKSSNNYSRNFFDLNYNLIFKLENYDLTKMAEKAKCLAPKENEAKNITVTQELIKMCLKWETNERGSLSEMKKLLGIQDM